MQVEGAGERHGLSAGRVTTTAHSVVAAGVRCDPASSARPLHASKTGSAPRRRTALRHSRPSKPFHRRLEAACGWLRRKDERRIANLVPSRRRATADEKKIAADGTDGGAGGASVS